MRASHEQIDNAILDAAAGLFADQGFDRTSVQQVADAVGYSKTGLLHRFPSKQALLGGVHALLQTTLAQAAEQIASVPRDADYTRAVLAIVVDKAMAHTGGVRYLLRFVESAVQKTDEIGQAVTLLVDLLAGPDASDARLVTVALALELICNGCVLGRNPEHDLGTDLAPLLTELAARVIGDPATTS